MINSWVDNLVFHLWIIFFVKRFNHNIQEPKNLDHWCRRHSFGVAKDILSKFPRKTFCDKLSPYKCSVAVVSSYFPIPSCHRLENRKFGTCNVLLNNLTEKSTLGCARILSEDSWLSTLEHLPHSSEVCRSFTFQLLLSARNLTPSWGRPKAVCTRHASCAVFERMRLISWRHVLFWCVWYGLRSSRTCFYVDASDSLLWLTFTRVGTLNLYSSIYIQVGTLENGGSKDSIGEFL